jgi:hypothetical protein
VGLYVRFSPAYPFVTNMTALPSPLVIATAPRQFVTDSQGYLSDPTTGGSRDCLLVASDDPDISPTGWRYLVTFSGNGSTHFRSFRTPAPANAIVDMAIITPQRQSTGATPSTVEAAAAAAAASAASATAAAASIQRGQPNGVAPLDSDGDVNDSHGNKILGGGGGGSGSSTLAGITDMSPLARLLNKETTATDMRSRIGAGTGNSNVAIGTTAGTAADAAATNTAIATKATDSTVVHKTTDETISGVKTFTGPVNLNGAVTIAGGSFGTPSIPVSEKGTPGGVAALDLQGRVLNGSGGPISGVSIGSVTGTAADGGAMAAALADIAIDIYEGDPRYTNHPVTQRIVHFWGHTDPGNFGDRVNGGGGLAAGDVWFQLP